MPLLSNEYFDPGRLIEFMRDKSRKNSGSIHLMGIKKTIKSLYFEPQLSDQEVLRLLKKDKRFDDYEYLRSIFVYLLSAASEEVSPEKCLNDLSQISGSHGPQEDTELYYRKLNQEYRYFEEGMPIYDQLFGVLSHSFRAMIVFYGHAHLSAGEYMMGLLSFVWRDAAWSGLCSLFLSLNFGKFKAAYVTAQAHFCAYATMVLFADKMDLRSVDISYKRLSIELDKLLCSIKNISRRTHDFHFEFLSEKLSLPRADQIKDIAGWRELVRSAGVDCFPLLKMAHEIEARHQFKAPDHLVQGRRLLATVFYERGDEDPELAYLCYLGGISHQRFLICLDYIGSGWPKKHRDNLPSCRVEKHGFRYVKMEKEDKRTLFLGDLTHNCMSVGGHADAGKYSVYDAIEKENHGFYVLLDKNQKIIGMSYVWISRAGNLCIDSIEILRYSIKENELFDILALFAEKVLKTDPSIRRITLGAGGGTRHFSQVPFKRTSIPEMIKEGYAHRDSSIQYCIQSSVVDAREQSGLEQLFQNQSSDFKECMTYLYEQLYPAHHTFISEIKQLIDTYPQIITQLTPNNTIRFFAFAKPLSPDDLKPLSWMEFEQMPAELRANIPTARLVFWNDNRLISQILHLIPREDLYPLMGKNQQDAHELLEAAAHYPEAFRAMFSVYPEDERWDILLKKKHRHINAPLLDELLDAPATLLEAIILLPSDLRVALLDLPQVYQALRKLFHDPVLLKKYLSLLDTETRFMILTKMNHDGYTMLHEALQSPDTIEIALSFLRPDQKMWALHQQYTVFDKTVLQAAIAYPESLYRILSLLPDPLKAIMHKAKNGNTLLHEATHEPTILAQILSFVPDEKRLEALMMKGAKGQELLDLAMQDPSSGVLKSLIFSLPEKQRLSVLIRRDSQDRTLLHRLIEYPKLMVALIASLPEKQQDAALNVTDGLGKKPLDDCKNLEWVVSIESLSFRQKLMKWMLHKHFSELDIGEKKDAFKR